ncbi:tripartite motif-containing protein 2-like [Mytilus edulis]|uniref:tripartite motif-containing protein 2-like n=1 Tax=Mytilus edulis TaxID=6550 RepID=UPI0039EE32FD
MEKALKIQILCQFCDGQAIQWKCDECEKFMCLPCKELVHDNLKSLQHHGIANVVDIVKDNPDFEKDNSAESEVASEVISSVLNSFTTTVPVINSLVCSEDGCVYFIHQKIAEKSILVKGELKEPSIKLSKSLKKRIFDIAINRDDELLFNEMVDNNNVCILSQSGEINTVIDTSPMRPLSLHVNNDKELIVGIKEQGPIFPVQKDSVRQVIIFGSDNKRKVTLETDTTGRKLFNYPARIETDSANVLYVADWMDTDLSGRVVAVDTNGNLKFAYAGHQDLQPFFPHGIAITPSDNIILSDQSNNALHVLNSTGELLGLHLLDSILHIKAPLSLCFDHEGHLLIGSGKLDNSNAKIYVTKVAKKFIYIGHV